MDTSFQLGKRLRELRQFRGMSQETLALNAGITPAYLGMVERGEKNPTVRIIEQLCRVLDVSLADFFQNNEKNLCEDPIMEQILYCLRDKSESEKKAFLQLIQQILILQRMN